MPSELLGQTLLSQYKIEEFIAETPLGELYRAIDVRTNRSYAFTLLPKSISEKIEAVKELEAESAALRGIKHPNITPYLGVFQTPTLAFFLEEWIDGPSLLNIIERAPVTVHEALIYLKALCGALETLHRKNYVHCHLAPQLIRINKRGEIFLSGIATARQVGDMDDKRNAKYPSLYLAPEQLRSQAQTPATDTYSLTVLLYQLITGNWINGKTPPKTNEAIRKVHLELDPPLPISPQNEIPDHFARMVVWALRKKPQDRLKTTTELLSSLCLAARLSVDQIPLHAEPRTAEVTGAVLKEWKFLPPLKHNIIQQDTTPLQDRLAALIPETPKRARPKVGFVPIFLLVVFASFISLFLLIHPAPTDFSIPLQFTRFVSNYTPQPTLTALPRPTSEHGARIVFTCTRGDYNQLCMVNRDGTGLSQLTDMQASNYYPVFTHDGGSLLFASNRNGSFDLYLQQFDQKQLIQLTQNVGNVISPDYSPDGRTIVFANRVGNSPTSIWTVNAEGLNPQPIYSGPRDIVAVAWAPNGEKIAYAMSSSIAQEYQIYTMDPNGRNNLQISHGMQGIGGSISWSPDSKYLLIYAGPYNDKDIFRIDATTGDFTQLTSGGNNAGGVYSPDGRYIVFNSLRNKDQADLYIMRADGTNQQQLTNNPEPDWGAQWEP